MDKVKFIEAYDRVFDLISQAGLDLSHDVHPAGFSLRLGPGGWAMVLFDTGSGDRLGSFEVRVGASDATAVTLLRQDVEDALTRRTEAMRKALKEAA